MALNDRIERMRLFMDYEDHEITMKASEELIQRATKILETYFIDNLPPIFPNPHINGFRFEWQDFKEFYVDIDFNLDNVEVGIYHKEDIMTSEHYLEMKFFTEDDHSWKLVSGLVKQIAKAE